MATNNQSRADALAKIRAMKAAREAVRADAATAGAGGLSAKEAGIRLPKLPTPQYPLRAERAYVRELQGVVGIIKKSVRAVIFPELERLVELARPRRADERVDGLADDLDEVLERFEQESEQQMQNREMLANRHAQAVAALTLIWWLRSLRKTIGFEVYVSEGWMADALKMFSLENAALIRSISDRAKGEVASVVRRGLVERKGQKWIQAEIQRRLGISERRAKLIARDQTGKLEGRLAQLRQERVGIDLYVWRTRLDDRVRPHHRSKEGQRFSWAKPPSDTGHPGQDINCRCFAEPVMEKFYRLPEGAVVPEGRGALAVALKAAAGAALFAAVVAANN